MKTTHDTNKYDKNSKYKVLCKTNKKKEIIFIYLYDDGYPKRGTNIYLKINNNVAILYSPLVSA